MDPIFDVLKLLPDGPLWITAVQGLREANEEVSRLVQTSPGEYSIRLREEVVQVEQSEDWAEVT